LDKNASALSYSYKSVLFLRGRYGKCFLFVSSVGENYNYNMAREPRKVIRLYADTSVFGGVFDIEFEAPSKAFFEAVRKSRFSLVTSELVRQEIQAAPEKVKKLFYEILPIAEITEVTNKALKLQQAYIDAEILSEKYSTDALHVALATVSKV
jgi:predicted nucleic acid-binding protein